MNNKLIWLATKPHYFLKFCIKYAFIIRDNRDRIMASGRTIVVFEGRLSMKDFFLFSNFLIHNLGLFKNTCCYVIESKLWL